MTVIKSDSSLLCCVTRVVAMCHSGVVISTCTSFVFAGPPACGSNPSMPGGHGSFETCRGTRVGSSCTATCDFGYTDILPDGSAGQLFATCDDAADGSLLVKGTCEPTGAALLESHCLMLCQHAMLAWHGMPWPETRAAAAACSPSNSVCSNPVPISSHECIPPCSKSCSQ
jgi:hypothetical protein